MRKIIILTIPIAALFLSSCAQYYLDNNAFSHNPPKTVGIIIGHDVYAKKGLSPEDAILQTSTLGMFNLAVRSRLIEKRIDFVDQINEKILDRVNQEMVSKGYELKLLKMQHIEWHRYEHLRDRKDMYSNLTKKYLTESPAEEFDAILIIEYMLEGKIKGFRQEGEKVEKLSAENMKVKWAESKTFLYDTRTGQRLFFDHILKDYGKSEGVTVSESLKNLIQLKPIPDSAN